MPEPASEPVSGPASEPVSGPASEPVPGPASQPIPVAAADAAGPLPPPLVATARDLPKRIREGMAAPDPGTDGTTEARGIPFAWTAWGPPEARPILLVHGVTSSRRTFWRLGPALAAAGRRVIAVDLPGHGGTGHWTGHHRWRDNAADLTAFVRAALLGEPADAAWEARLVVVGHSWGAMTAAALPVAGLRPRRLVLLDPPAMRLADAEAMTLDPVERHYDDLDEAVAVIAAAHPDWSRGDVLAKAEGLHRSDETAVRDILLRNGDWDAGLADLGDPAARGVETWIVRGDPEAGGLLPDEAARSFIPLVGAHRILTLSAAGHSPQRTHLEATLVALLRAIGLDADVVGSADGPWAVER